MEFLTQNNLEDNRNLQSPDIYSCVYKLKKIKMILKEAMGHLHKNLVTVKDTNQTKCTIFIKGTIVAIGQDLM